MSPQQAQSYLDQAQWKLLVLALAWALQLFFAISCLGIWSSHLNAAVQQDGPAYAAQLVCEAINMAVAIAAAACTILEVVRYTVKKLTAPTLLYVQLVQSGCAATLLILSVFLYSKDGERDYALAPLILSIMLLITAAALAIYAIMTIRRIKARCISPEAAKSFSFAISPEGALSGLHAPHSLAAASAWPADSSDTHRGIVAYNKSVTYNHKRDTQFDDYVATLLGFPARIRPNAGLNSSRHGDMPQTRVWSVDLVRDERRPSRDDVLSVVHEEDDEHEYG